MEPGDIVIYTFIDMFTKDEVWRPAIITSKSTEGSCDSHRNLYVFFEPDDNPSCRPGDNGEMWRYWNSRYDVPFGDGAMTWRRK